MNWRFYPCLVRGAGRRPNAKPRCLCGKPPIVESLAARVEMDGVRSFEHPFSNGQQAGLTDAQVSYTQTEMGLRHTRRDSISRSARHRGMPDVFRQ